MDALKQSGTLPFGIEVDGVLHRDFVLRPRKVRDSVEAAEDPRCATNGSYNGVFLYAAQLEVLGTLKKDQITAELLQDMFDADMEELIAKAEELNQRVKTFRSVNQGSAEAATGTGEGGGAVGSGT